MPFMKGVAPIRRTTKYLARCPLVLKPRVKVMTVNFNDKGEEHSEGVRDFVFWNLPQIQYKNPNVQIVTFKDMTPSPFITCFMEDNSKVYFDVDSQTNKEIMDRLVKTVGKSKQVLEEEAIASEAKSNPANFNRRLGFERHCICEMPGQVPCPSVVPVPIHWRGKWWNQGHRYEEEE
eukprot:TRINITY_DN38787_c0_g1_i1.p1 TRINITY_DN38787_c0_g1~~TRINITY_DN38787_c0_g1_i1.p1  ORF type:complete len:177 (+),score=30.62 TRINITY_DN38787_c0_g1_i1:57-587(+)